MKVVKSIAVSGLSGVVSCSPTPLTVAAIHDISRRSVSCLSGQEEKWLSDAEKLANLDKLSTLEELKLEAEAIARTVNYHHKNWVLNLVWQNIENFESGEVGGLGNANCAASRASRSRQIQARRSRKDST
ncbi:MAG: hypothetical protein ACFBSE_18610 [Prochloraceae cyanobacterium]